MITKRIIPCLDVKDGRVVKGVQFVQLRDAGDPVELAKAYDEQGADELVFLDISASHEGRKTMVDVVERVAAELAIPFTVGGGIHSLDDMKRMLRAGEILLTSMDADGGKNGFDIALTRRVSEAVSVPVIASGGAGKAEHFLEAFEKGKADAALAASIFHYKETSVGQVKAYLKERGVNVR